MKIQLFCSPHYKEDRIDIYCKRKTPRIQAIIDFAEKGPQSGKQTTPSLAGINNDEKVFLEPEQIYYFEVIDRKTFAYLETQVFQITLSLQELGEQLECYGFIRISKSVLVNIYKIERIKPELNMRLRAILENKEAIIINRSYKASFQAYLNKMRRIPAKILNGKDCYEKK